MKNNNINANKCEVKFNKFTKELTAGYNKVATKNIQELLLGIAKSESVLLSGICRAALKTSNIRKSVERFSRNLSAINYENLKNNAAKIVGKILPQNKIYLVDDTEIIKPLAKKMEGLALVTDGSDDHKLKPGYWINEIVALDKNHQPVSVSSQLYSAKEEGFLSANNVTQTAIKNVVKRLGKGLFVFDRGFDGLRMHEFMAQEGLEYMVRANVERHFLVNGNEINIEKASCLGSKNYALDIKFQGQKPKKLKVSFAKISLIKLKKVELTLVTIKGLGNENTTPLYIITNQNIIGKETCLRVAKTYLSRWKIEEYFKFKKQSYGLEKIQLKSLQALKNLNLLLSTTISFLAILGNSAIKNNLLQLAKAPTKKVAFIYYRLALGFSALTTNLKLITQKPKTNSFRHIPKQRDFFYHLRYDKTWKKNTQPA